MYKYTCNIIIYNITLTRLCTYKFQSIVYVIINSITKNLPLNGYIFIFIYAWWTFRKNKERHYNKSFFKSETASHYYMLRNGTVKYRN